MLQLISIAISSAALGISFSEPPQQQAKSMSLECRVTNVYGVPYDLKPEDLSKLGFQYSEGTEDSSEGDSRRTVDIVADNGVVVTAVFSLIDNQLSFLRTTSKKAVDPKGVKVGDTLETVRKAWPHGILQLPMREEGIKVPRYLTCSNISFILGKKEKGTDDTLFVEEIQIVDFVALKGRCPN